jgi:hypothetical protein
VHGAVRFCCCKQGQSDFTYDAYHRLTKIEDKVWANSSTHSIASKFDYEYDEVYTLLKEHYTKLDGAVGDRLARDEFHRLEKAWMGVGSTTIVGSDPTSCNPACWASSGIRESLACVDRAVCGAIPRQGLRPSLSGGC